MAPTASSRNLRLILTRTCRARNCNRLSTSRPHTRSEIECSVQTTAQVFPHINSHRRSIEQRPPVAIRSALDCDAPAGPAKPQLTADRTDSDGVFPCFGYPTLDGQARRAVLGFAPRVSPRNLPRSIRSCGPKTNRATSFKACEATRKPHRGPGPNKGLRNICCERYIANQPAQQDNVAISFENPKAASLIPSTVVRYGKIVSAMSVIVRLCLIASTAV